MLKTRISVFFFLTCLVLFSIGSFLSLPPQSDGWLIENTSLSDLISGKTTIETENELGDKLVYKNQATGFWGAIRYGIFKTGSDGVIIGKNDWLFTKEEFETDEKFTEIVKENTQRINRYISTLREYNIKPILLWIPSKSRIYNNMLCKKPPLAQRNMHPPHGVPIINGAEVFAKLKQPAFMRTDTHWSTHGAQAMAQAVKNYVTKHYSDLKLTRKTFTTTPTSAVSYRGDLAEFVPTGWATDVVGPRGEHFIPYLTQATDIAEGAGLFGDEQIDVTLIGTSYSAQKNWHFEGFLKQALQADVLNLADEGQGPFVPMDSFLERLKKGEVKTKLVIWEFPERYLPREYSPEDKKGESK